jgi:DNA-binding CsgD family transcriptional regulator
MAGSRNTTGGVTALSSVRPTAVLEILTDDVSVILDETPSRARHPQSPFEIGLSLVDRILLAHHRDEGARLAVQTLGVDLGIPAAAWSEYRSSSSAGFKLLDIAGPGDRRARGPLSDLFLRGSRTTRIQGLIAGFRNALRVQVPKVVDADGVVLLFAHSTLATEYAARAIREALTSIPVATRDSPIDRQAEARWTDAATEVLRLEQLTPRETQVLELLAEGGTSARIAETLEISPNTVRTHVQNILSKLAVGSRLEAAAIAARSGIGNLRRPVTGWGDRVEKSTETSRA